MSFTRTPIITDGFDSSGNWDGLVPNDALFYVDSSHFTSYHDATFLGGNPARWHGTDFDSTADQYAKAQIIVITADGGPTTALGVICRASADLDAARDFYFYRFKEDAGSSGSAARTTEIGSVKNGTETIHTTGSITWAPNDTIELECTGSSTVLLEGFKNGVSTGQTYSDSSSPLTTGRPGVLANISFQGDNFEGGSLTAGGGGRAGKNTRGWGLGTELGMGIWMPNEL